MNDHLSPKNTNHSKPKEKLQATEMCWQTEDTTSKLCVFVTGQKQVLTELNEVSRSF